MKYLLWDFDGTLAYREGMWTGTLHSLLVKHGITGIGPEDIRPFFNSGFSWHSPHVPHHLFFGGKPWWEYMEGKIHVILGKLGVDPSVSLTIASLVRNEYLEIGNWRVFPDSAAALERMRGLGYTNVMLSNHVPELKDLVSRLDLDRYFDRIYTSGLVGYEKPNPAIFEHALNDLGVPKDRCVMIGDSYEADIEGAVRVGLRAILVRSLNTRNWPYYSASLEGLAKSDLFSVFFPEQ